MCEVSIASHARLVAMLQFDMAMTVMKMIEKAFSFPRGPSEVNRQNSSVVSHFEIGGIEDCGHKARGYEPNVT